MLPLEMKQILYVKPCCYVYFLIISIPLHLMLVYIFIFYSLTGNRFLQSVYKRT